MNLINCPVCDKPLTQYTDKLVCINNFQRYNNGEHFVYYVNSCKYYQVDYFNNDDNKFYQLRSNLESNFIEISSSKKLNDLNKMDSLIVSYDNYINLDNDFSMKNIKYQVERLIKLKLLE